MPPRIAAWNLQPEGIGEQVGGWLMRWAVARSGSRLPQNNSDDDVTGSTTRDPFNVILLWVHGSALVTVTLTLSPIWLVCAENLFFLLSAFHHKLSRQPPYKYLHTTLLSFQTAVLPPGPLFQLFPCPNSDMSTSLWSGWCQQHLANISGCSEGSD